MRLVVHRTPGEFDKHMRGLETPLAAAATGAIRQAGAAALDAGRSNIATAGFSSRWQRALRADYTPQRGVSINTSVLLRHTIPFAGIFETGGTITGDLWVPITGALPKRMTPRKYVRSGGQLASVNIPGRKPMLVGKGRGGKRKPLFVGLRSVTIRKRFNLRAVFQRVADRLGKYLVEHLVKQGHGR